MPPGPSRILAINSTKSVHNLTSTLCATCVEKQPLRGEQQSTHARLTCCPPQLGPELDVDCGQARQDGGGRADLGGARRGEQGLVVGSMLRGGGGGGAAAGVGRGVWQQQVRGERGISSRCEEVM